MARLVDLLRYQAIEIIEEIVDNMQVKWYNKKKHPQK
jgi:hypothetical protein